MLPERYYYLRPGHYYFTEGSDRDIDELAIRSPDGREMAIITYVDKDGFDQNGRAIIDQASADAKLIIDALNAMKKGS